MNKKYIPAVDACLHTNMHVLLGNHIEYYVTVVIYTFKTPNYITTHKVWPFMASRTGLDWKLSLDWWAVSFKLGIQYDEKYWYE